MKHKPSIVPWVDNEGINGDIDFHNNEEALNYIVECAESVGIEVTEKTAFSIPFMAEVMKALREGVKPHE